MAARKTTKKITKTKVKVKATRVRKSKAAPLQKSKSSAFARFVNSLRFSDSYTSLVLGMIAVVIATILLLSVVHNRQASSPTPEATPTLAQSSSFAISPTATPVPTEKAQVVVGSTYTVMAGDNLWTIAEKVYKSGYNWVDISIANKLADPGNIHVGDKLIMPQVAPKLATVEIPTVHTADDNMSSTVAPSVNTTGSITSANYTVVRGDSLWSIAVRAYGDGYQWTKIAQANNLANPGLIHAGNVLRIPRG